MIPVSVGICAYNEEKNIGNLLSFLQKLNLRKFKIIEIIVVASGCTDKTPEIVKAFGRKDKRIKLITERERRGKASAFNKIIQAYRGDILMNVDADCYPGKNSIHFLLERFNDKGIGAVTGCPIPIGGKELAENMTKVIWELHAAAQKYFTSKGKFVHINGELFAIRKDVVDYVLKDIVNEDAYIAVKCKAKGYRLVMEDRAKIYFKSPTSISDLVSKRRRFVYGHLKVKKETGFTPCVLEMSPVQDQIYIISRFLRRKKGYIPYFLLACLLEIYVNVMARVDRLKKSPHVLWKVARTTKDMKGY
jgi:cellulose synthase/poly-beta-1,6-N-acetylglucosamine synthase-like glycosyltransferase